MSAGSETQWDRLSRCERMEIARWHLEQELDRIIDALEERIYLVVREKNEPNIAHSSPDGSA